MPHTRCESFSQAIYQSRICNQLRNSEVNLALRKEKTGTLWNCSRWVCHTFWHSAYSSGSRERRITCWLSFLLSVSCEMHFIPPSRSYNKMCQSQLFPLGTDLLTALLSTRQAVLVPDLRDIYSESWIYPGPRIKLHPRMSLLSISLFGIGKVLLQ